MRFMVTQSRRVRQCSQESGQILVLTTVSMIALLGVMALSLDTSFMLEKRNRRPAAADTAAKSGSNRTSAYPDYRTQQSPKICQQVIAHGFLPTRQGGTTNAVINYALTARQGRRSSYCVGAELC